MAKHLVKCFYCGETFDTEKEAFVKPTDRRYAHKHCDEQHNSYISQEEKDYNALLAYAKELFGSPINPKIIKQIKNFKADYDFSYSGILKTLKWWFEVQGNSIEQANGGIGIVPFVYKDAAQYYYSIYLATSLNENIQVQTPNIKIREVTIECPKPTPRAVHLFDLGEEN